jgi:hypothetical protein
MKINEQKTKHMIAARKRTILDTGQTVDFGNKNFKVVNELVFLGAEFGDTAKNPNCK